MDLLGVGGTLTLIRRRADNCLECFWFFLLLVAHILGEYVGFAVVEAVALPGHEFHGTLRFGHLPGDATAPTDLAHSHGTVFTDQIADRDAERLGDVDQRRDVWVVDLATVEFPNSLRGQVRCAG